MRRYLDDHGYIEVETPMLSPIASGAAARPFVTHHNALDIDLYLRIAPELYLKRLLVGGFERVYELNRNFRNEGISARHNPEFTMLEFYTAYKDVNWMMDFCEEMIRQTVEKVTGGTTVRFEEHELDFGCKFERLTMKQAIAQYWPPQWAVWSKLGGDKFQIEWLDVPEVLTKLYIFAHSGAQAFILQMYGHSAEVGLSDSAIKSRRESNAAKIWESEVEPRFNDSNMNFKEFTDEKKAHYIEALFASVAEENLVQPVFIHDFPKPISPLSKASPDDPAIAERFELYVAGMEVANGFSELNDPEEQYQRFEEQTRQRESGDEEAMRMDEDYVRALSYGMPPAAGIGIGVDRLTMLLTNRRSIRDVILFPHMRPQKATEEQSPVTEEAEGASSEA
jgi:lysyl-tRNA synthetase class 2